MESVIARLRRWVQPSLNKRVVLSVMGAAVLVTVVLVLVDYVSYRRDLDRMQTLQDAVQAAALTLPDDEPGALHIVRATEQQYAYLRERVLPAHAPTLKALLFELSSTRDGRVLYATPGLAGTALPAQTVPVLTLDVKGQRYSAVQAERGPWRLRLLQPLLTDLSVLEWLAQNLATSVLIAVPFVLLPVWLGVRRGLAPLRRLVAEVTGRRQGDFAPLKMEVRLAELKPLVESFNELLARSRAALARERGLVQDAAHELRTPLAVIATQAHALVHAEPGPARQMAQDRLEHAIARASHQVHQVLTLARMEGQSARQTEPLECVETLRLALIDAEPRARARGIHLALEAPDRVDAELDRVALHSIVENLLTNALNHATGATRIQVELQATADRLTLQVADDGAGVPADDLPHLFERFHRGRQATSAGSGLGLSIVREAARQMGGDVRHGPGLDGRGAGFVVELRRGPPAR